MNLNKKKFDKYVKETILDFKAVGRNDLAKEYKKILKEKYLTVVNVQPLVNLILCSEEEGYILSQIEKEHKYMKKYLEQFFTFEKRNELILIQSKNTTKESK